MRATDIEDRLEELFMRDSNSRHVTSVSVPARPNPWRAVVALSGVAVIVGVVAVAVIAALRNEAQVAAPPTASPMVTPTAVGSATPAPVATGTVTGRLGYPSEFIPALAIYALPTNNTADGRHVIFTERTREAPGDVTYTMQVPAGTYYFVAYSREAPPGVTLAGGYTRYVTCGLQPPCSDHALIPVTVIAGQTVTGVDIRDWYLPPGESFPPRPGTSSPSSYESPLGYSVRLPEGWRRSESQSRTTPFPPGGGDPDMLGSERFTARTPADEERAIRASDTGVGPALAYTAGVSLYRNTRNLSALAYADREKGAYGVLSVSIEPTMVDGRAGAKSTFKFTQADTRTFYSLYVPEGDRMWVIQYFLSYPDASDVPPSATEEEVRSIVESFRFAR
jgi:hypothetical protein